MGRTKVDRAVAQIGVVVLVVVAAIGCGSGNTTPANVTPDPQTGTAIDGRYELKFTVDRTTLKPGDNISGTAELWLKAGGSGVLSGPSQLFAFEFVEVGGQQRAVAPAVDSDCSPHQLGQDRPLTSPIYRSGAPGTGANGDFVSQFLQGETINLPAGTWDISAVAGFFDGRSCGGLRHTIRSTIRVQVNA
ncbi:MAG TPA: hypothetical protein VHR16_10560 [Candidatus Limnocylindrales bacterium]|nr:hypothetical protein [Candidatus Limnocylindrales bacterium]